MKVTFVDHSEEVKSALNKGIHNGLWAIGSAAEGYAKDNTPVDTGRLRNSITHAEDDNEKTMCVGSNLEYAPYVELGTGIYASEGMGRKTAWMVVPDGSGQYDEPFYTRGIKPAHMLRDSIKNNTSEFQKLLEEALKAVF